MILLLITIDNFTNFENVKKKIKRTVTVLLNYLRETKQIEMHTKQLYYFEYLLPCNG